MKFYDMKSFYIVTDVKEHAQNKNKFLELIDSMPQSNLEGISKTDWNLPKEQKREYLDYFYEMIIPYMNEMASLLKCKTWSIDNGWFQQYNIQDNHGWHTHEKSNYTNVYYLHLPNNSIKTEVYDVTNNTIINDFDVKEGQILTFAAGTIHRSPLNDTDDKKVVIAFNSNFDNVALTF